MLLFTGKIIHDAKSWWNWQVSKRAALFRLRLLACLHPFSFSYRTFNQEMVCVHLVTLIYSIVIQGCVIHFIVFIQHTPPAPQAIMHWQPRPNLDLCSKCRGPTRRLGQNRTEKTSIASGSSRQPVKLMDLFKFRGNWKTLFCCQNPSISLLQSSPSSLHLLPTGTCELLAGFFCVFVAAANTDNDSVCVHCQFIKWAHSETSD